METAVPLAGKVKLSRAEVLPPTSHVTGARIRWRTAPVTPTPLPAKSVARVTAAPLCAQYALVSTRNEVLMCVSEW